MNNTLVIGNGEIGKPLADLLAVAYPVQTKDIEDVTVIEPIHWMHICFPYSDTFVDNVIEYIEQYKPNYTIIHSTVVPGTTESIQNSVESPVVYSPVRGRHLYMHRDMMRYTKFIAHNDRWHLEVMSEYFENAHFKTHWITDTTTLELSKLVETLMPNIELLLQLRESVLLRAIQSSNDEAAEWDDDKRHNAVKL